MISAATYFCLISAIIPVAPLPLAVKTAPNNVFDQGHGQPRIVLDPVEPQLSRRAKSLQASQITTTTAAAALSDGTLMDIAADAPTAAVTGTHGTEDLAAFGDDVVFQNRALNDGNRKLAANLGTWLTRH